MIFEIHITVDSDDFEGFKKVCEENGITPLWIQNSKGIHNRQMLCALSSDRTAIRSDTVSLMHEISKIFRKAGFPILREKIECPLGYPLQAAYHECHIKLITPESDAEDMLAFCEQYNISASWSLIHNVPGERKWYLTVRDYESDWKTAHKKFLTAHHAVQTEWGKIKGLEMETAIFDTNKDLDMGWA